MDKGKIFYRKDIKLWGVRLSWEGAQYKLHYVPADVQIPCRDEQTAELLKVIINDDMEAGTFNPKRYRKNGVFRLSVIFKEFLKVQKERAEKETIAWGTYNMTRLGCNKILPLLGNRLIHTIKTKDYKKLFDDLAPLKKNTRKNYMSYFFEAMDYAVEESYIAKAPTRLEFKEDHAINDIEPIKSITVADQLKVLSFIKPIHHPIFQFLMFTGVRTSEARALRKADLHPETERITIAKSFKRGKKGQVLGSTKQKKKRDIDYPVELQKFIESLPENDSDFVFPHPVSGMPYGESYRRIWNNAVKKAGLEHCKLKNGTRHSFGKRLQDNGLPIELISGAFGHSDKKITEGHYVEKDTLAPNRQANRKVINVTSALLIKTGTG